MTFAPGQQVQGSTSRFSASATMVKRTAPNALRDAHARRRRQVGIVAPLDRLDHLVGE